MDFEKELQQVKQQIKIEYAEIVAIEEQLIDEEDAKKQKKLTVKLKCFQEKLASLEKYRSEVITAASASQLQVLPSSTKKQKQYKGMRVEASCRKYFDALALKLSGYYKFSWGHLGNNPWPSIGDVINAKENKTWKYTRRPKTVEERTNENGFIEPPSKVPKLPIPLPNLFSDEEWKKLKEFNRKINDRIHSGVIAATSTGKPLVILPHSEFNDETIAFLKSVGTKGKLFAYKEDLIVKDELILSGSSNSESGSPDKDKDL